MQRLFRELKRRNVYRVAATYAAVAFVTLQAARLIFPATTLEGLYDKLVVLAFVGFPIALVIAWASELTPEGVRRTQEASDAEEPAAMEAPGAGRAAAPAATGSPTRLALGALVALGLLAAVGVGTWYLMGSAGAAPEMTDGTVAVLPFEVSGAGAEQWGNPMVSLLSTGLDGAGGLRAIADRTVFSAWKRAGTSSGAASTHDALSVARELGAEHAVIGSAATLGGELQLVAAVYATRSGERLDRVEVRGSPDSVSTLTHALTRQVIGVLAAEAGEELRSAKLASVLTDSVDALKRYVSGLRHVRLGAYETAVGDFEAAVRVDSTFALPYARLALYGLWSEDPRDDAMRRAHELADGLPERERRLVEALHLGSTEHRTLAAADSLRRLTRDYPDDPSVWRTRGELVLHAYIPGGTSEGEEAHRRAVELDPGNTGSYAHYVLPAFYLDHDSAMAARRIARMPGGKEKRLYRLGLMAVFGSPGARERALAAYDTVSVPERWMALGPLGAPEELELRDEVARRLLERDVVDPAVVRHWLLVNDLERGRPDQYLRDVGRWEPEDDQVAYYLAVAASLGVPLPDSMERRYVAPDELPTDPSLGRLRGAAFYGIERGRMEAAHRLLQRLEGDSAVAYGLPSPEREAIVRELQGVRAWKQGDLERAARLLSRSNESSIWGALWRGDLYRELGELERAEDWYRVFGMPVVAWERLGQLYEEMDRPGAAAAAYRRFIAAWEDADEALQPRVEDARERVRRLTGSEGAPDG